MADKKNNIFTLYSNKKDEEPTADKLPLYAPVYGEPERKFGLLFYGDNDILISKPYANLVEVVCASPYEELLLLYTDGSVVRIQGRYLSDLITLINRAALEGLGIYEEGLYIKPPEGEPIITSITQSPYHDDNEA